MDFVLKDIEWDSHSVANIIGSKNPRKQRQWMGQSLISKLLKSNGPFFAKKVNGAVKPEMQI